MPTHKLALAIIVPPLLFVSLACGQIQVSSNAGTITISDAYTTTGLDEGGQPLDPTAVFDTNQDTIYLIVLVDSPSPVRVGVRWFFEDELISDQSSTVQGGGGWWWLTPPPGEAFQPGDYRAEVYLVEDAIRTVNFTVAP